jgi:predicted TIM-barrel fold metal-dependent hydrolase
MLSPRPAAAFIAAHRSAFTAYNTTVNRRTFITAAASLAAGAGAQSASIPIIDTHIHLFDPRRPEGVPWPDKNNRVLYRPALPERYRQIAAPLGIVGAIEVECSPWLEDNQWVLDVAAKDTMIVGTVGNLEPGHPDFRKHLERFHRNPLFRGIRYGSLWGRDLGARLAKPEFVAGLKALAQADLSLDVAGPTPPVIAAVVRVSDLVPGLRIIVDHLPQAAVPSEPSVRRTFDSNVRELGTRPQVYVKLSEVLQRVDGKVPTDVSFYRAKLDELCGIFGEDRVIYGSDWPNSDQWAPYEQVLRVVRDYFASKDRATAEKYFWKNSVAAYRWMKRAPDQPQAISG